MAGKDIIHFSGKPRRMRAELPLGANWKSRVAELSIEGFNESYRVKIGRLQSRLRTRLDQFTHPGQYRGELKLVNGAVYPAVVEVHANTRLSAVPAVISFSGIASSKQNISLQLTNRGNTPIDIPAVAITGVFDTGGFENAFAATYKFIDSQQQKQQPEKEKASLSDYLIGQFHRGYGGLLTMKIRQGGERLEQGQTMSLDLSTTLPANLVPGHSYSGTWVLESMHLPVVVDVPRKKSNRTK